MSDMLAARNLSCRLGGKDILQDISFSVAEGECWSIIGCNGAGKSTLLKCLAGLMPAGAGRMEIAGRAVAEYPRRELARQVAYVPQNLDALPPFTVREFVEQARYPWQRWADPMTDKDRAVVDRALARTGIAAFADRTLHTLSGGERQLTVLAAALAQEARIVLLDEPAAFLDYRRQTEITLLLKNVMRPAGLTVLAVHHDLNLAMEWGAHALALKNGRIAYAGATENLHDPDLLGGIFGAEFEVLSSPHSTRRWIAPVREGRGA